MAEIMQIRGVRQAVKALQRQSTGYQTALARGLKRAGLFLQRMSMLEVPVDIGNLHNSAFTRAGKELGEPIVTVGYTASYAVFVHEVLYSWHKPPTKAKFLEDPAKTHRGKIIRIIQSELKSAKVGGVRQGNPLTSGLTDMDKALNKVNAQTNRKIRSNRRKQK